MSGTSTSNLPFTGIQKAHALSNLHAHGRFRWTSSVLNSVGLSFTVKICAVISRTSRDIIAAFVSICTFKAVSWSVEKTSSSKSLFFIKLIARRFISEVGAD